MAQRPQASPVVRNAAASPPEDTEEHPPEEFYEEQPGETPDTVEGDPGVDLPGGPPEPADSEDK
jgi:hypothetical protein